MNNNDLNVIIDYAVEKEQEAIDFYSELLKQVKLPNIQKEISDIILMEEGHINYLNTMRSVDQNCFIQNQIQRLNIGDYYEEPVSYKNLDYPALLLIAIKREDKAKKLYMDLAAYSSDEKIRNIFSTLSKEEEKHQLSFEKIYNDNVLINN